MEKKKKYGSAFQQFGNFFGEISRLAAPQKRPHSRQEIKTEYKERYGVKLSNSQARRIAGKNRTPPRQSPFSIIRKGFLQSSGFNNDQLGRLPNSDETLFGGSGSIFKKEKGRKLPPLYEGY